MTDKTLVTSKLYALARQQSLLAFLQPDFPTMMAVEQQLDSYEPRTETDKDATRILVNYTNAKGNAILYPITDHVRLERIFDLDDFMNGYLTSIGDEAQITGMDPVDAGLVSVLNFCVRVVLQFESNVSSSMKTLSLTVLQSLVSIVYDDPLDVVISVNETPVVDNPDKTVPILAAMWTVKQRYVNVTIPSTDTIQ